MKKREREKEREKKRKGKESEGGEVQELQKQRKSLLGATLNETHTRKNDYALRRPCSVLYWE